MSNRFIGARQTTIAQEIQVHGTGVHSGAPVSVSLHPAGADTGLRFVVMKRGRVTAEIPAKVCNVKNLTLCTVIGDESGATVSTVEHLLAALRGLHIDNCIIEIEGKEAPIMDSSALSLEMSPGVFRNEIAHARTFGFMSDVERLWKAGLALGANLTNTVAIGDDRIMNREGLRDPLEFVRHKMLDAVGDLSLSGHPLLGAYRSVKGGHRLNALVLQKLLEDSSAWSIVQAPRVREPRAVAFERATAAVAVAAE